MNTQIFRSKAPLRLGLGGGGSDVSPYSDNFGGAILNATINMFAYATIEPLDEKKIIFHLIDRNKYIECPSDEYLDIDGEFDLAKGVYNTIVRDYVHQPLSFKLTTYVDAPPGSGLGSSSTLIVAIIGAFSEWLKLPFGDYDIANLAWKIERKDLNMAGGKQDQYAATFGGFNFMEFYKNDRVIVNPLRIQQRYKSELEFNIILFYTGLSRNSSKIINDQSKSLEGKQMDRLEAMHEVKKYSYLLKEALLTGRLDDIGEILRLGWMCKKNTSSAVSSPYIDEIFETALKAGATGGKISGAGGGGFMFFYCPGNTRYNVIDKLKKFGGKFRRFNFTEHGLFTWEKYRG